MLATLARAERIADTDEHPTVLLSDLLLVLSGEYAREFAAHGFYPRAIWADLERQRRAARTS